MAVDEVLRRASRFPYNRTCKNGYNVHRDIHADTQHDTLFTTPTALCMNQISPVNPEQFMFTFSRIDTEDALEGRDEHVKVLQDRLAIQDDKINLLQSERHVLHGEILILCYMARLPLNLNMFCWLNFSKMSRLTR